MLGICIFKTKVFQWPNTRLQRTPLRAEQDRAFFSAGVCYNVVAIYGGGAAKAQPVGWLSCERTQHLVLYYPLSLT